MPLVGEQPFNQLINRFVGIGRDPYLAFPDDRHPPAPFAKVSDVPTVSLLIGGKFCCPEAGTSRRRCCEAAFRVSVPVATVNEYDRTMAGHDKIRTSRQVLAMQPVAETGSMQSSSNVHFRFGVYATNASHHSRTRFWVYDVRHVNWF